VALDFSRTGKPTDNAYIEALNARIRAECLNTSWFLSMADARDRIEEWRRQYNGGANTMKSEHTPRSAT
jgi:putative transposase